MAKKKTRTKRTIADILYRPLNHTEQQRILESKTDIEKRLVFIYLEDMVIVHTSSLAHIVSTA